MPLVRHLLLAILVTAPAFAAAIDVPGVAHLELPEGLLTETDLALEKIDATGIHLRPGERVLSGVRIRGAAPLKSERAPLIEGRLSFSTGSRSKAQSVVVRTRALRFTLTAYEPRAGLAGGTVNTPVPLPTWLSGPVEVFLIDHENSIEQVQAARLVEDPRDGAPLGERRPLILVHGKDNHDLSESYHHDAKLKPFEGLRSSPDYARIRKLYKPYFFQYPSYRSAAENGAELVRLAREAFGTRPERIAILAHSMGGLVSRRALATGGFAGEVSQVITTSSPHHGALASSLIFANERISERIGAFATLLLRFGKSGEPDTPGLRSVAWDNFDGGISASDAALCAPLVNEELARFNASFTHSGKLVTLMGDVRNLLWSHGIAGVKDEAYRKVQGAWGEKYANADPMVCLVSGTFEGAPVKARVVFDNFNHEQIVGSKRAVAAIFRLLQGEALAVP